MIFPEIEEKNQIEFICTVFAHVLSLFKQHLLKQNVHKSVGRLRKIQRYQFEQHKIFNVPLGRHLMVSEFQFPFNFDKFCSFVHRHVAPETWLLHAQIPSKLRSSGY